MTLSNTTDQTRLFRSAGSLARTGDLRRAVPHTLRSAYVNSVIAFHQCRSACKLALSYPQGKRRGGPRISSPPTGRRLTLMRRGFRGAKVVREELSAVHSKTNQKNLDLS
jgi:hypothetical protein